jgi:hypothetical protein
MDNKINCRKCGGPHLTIKCGKENNSFNNQLFENSNCETPKKTYNTNKYNKQTYHTIYRIKLSELPNDITHNEISELMNDWGHINKIKLVLAGDTTTAYIDFGYKEEAEYFVSAIDKTPFDYRILSACIVETTMTK